jgi:hypothetical protein
MENIFNPFKEETPLKQVLLGKEDNTTCAFHTLKNDTYSDGYKLYLDTSTITSGTEIKFKGYTLLKFPDTTYLYLKPALQRYRVFPGAFRLNDPHSYKKEFETLENLHIWKKPIHLDFENATPTSEMLRHTHFIPVWTVTNLFPKEYKKHLEDVLWGISRHLQIQNDLSYLPQTVLVGSYIKETSLVPPVLRINSLSGDVSEQHKKEAATLFNEWMALKTKNLSLFSFYHDGPGIITPIATSYNEAEISSHKTLTLMKNFNLI